MIFDKNRGSLKEREMRPFWHRFAKNQYFVTGKGIRMGLTGKRAMAVKKERHFAFRYAKMQLQILAIQDFGIGAV
jgi:hypothetical protein